jgi:glucokinase
VKPYLLGLDIGGTKTAVVLAKNEDDLPHAIIGKAVFPTEADKPYQDWAKRAEACIKGILSKYGIRPSEIESAGVSCGSPMDAEKGIIMAPANLPNFVDVHITDFLTGLLGCPSYLENDANACALAEWKFGAGRGHDDVVFLTFGTGMGAGLILNGRIYRGKDGNAGEVGHLRLEDDGPVGCGKAGSAEGFCSGGGIARLGQMEASRLIKEGNPPAWCKDESHLDKITTKLLSEYAKAGDEDAKRIFDVSAREFGKLLSIIIDVLNPEVIVVGSVYARSRELFDEGIEEVIKKEAIQVSARRAKIAPAELGESLGDVAALIIARQDILK